MNIRLIIVRLIFIVLTINNGAFGQDVYTSSIELSESLAEMDQDDPLFVTTTHDLALKYKSEGYFTLAKETFMAGMAHFRQKDSITTDEFAYLMADLGELYWEKGELTIAQDLYYDAEGILSQIPYTNNSDQYLRLKINLAIADARLGNNLSAMMGFNQVRTLFEREFQNQQVRIVNTILSIADVYSEIENLQRAESLYFEAEDMLGSVENEKYDLRISLLQKKAAYQKKISDLKKGIEYQKEAIELIITSMGKTNSIYAVAMSDLGNLYLENGQIEQAEASLSEALEIQKIIFGTYHGNYLLTLALLGDLHRTSNNVDKAAGLYESVISENLRQLSLLSPIMGVQERTSYILTISQLLNKYASLAETNTDLQAQIYSNLIDQHFIVNDLQMHPPIDLSSDFEDFVQWRNQAERLLHLYKQPQTEVTGGLNTLDKIEQEILSLEKRMSKKNGIEIKRGHKDRTRWRDLQNYLKDGEVAVEVVRYPWFSNEDVSSASKEVHYLFIYFDTDSELPNGILLTNGNDMENRFLTHYRNSINHRFPNDYAYEVYWLPIKDQLDKYATILISPAGAYSQINLLTMRNIETGNFLIDEKNINVVTSITHHGMRPDNEKGSQNVVHIFGNPDYNLKEQDTLENIIPYEIYTSDQGESGMYYMRNKIKQQILWNELLYIDDVKIHEVGLLNDLYKSEGFSTEVYTEDSAKEAKLKNLKNPHTLHISTHGYFMEDDDINTGKYLDNQLLHSGLIFSGCYDYLDNKKLSFSQEDGLLTTYEIANLELEETELIFLSSCETGLGIVNNGNAISNFQHAFQEAGAGSLIMTLWTTESEYQLEFMNLFYYHWLYEKMPKREAFLKSVKIMRDSYEKPYYWGSFIFVGE